MSIRPIRFVRAMIVFTAPLAFWAAAVSGQDTDFDIDIARISDSSMFEPFRVSESEPLRDAMSAGKVQGDTRVLVVEHPAVTLAFVTDQMAYHHVAQGETNGEPWMVSF